MSTNQTHSNMKNVLYYLVISLALLASACESEPALDRSISGAIDTIYQESPPAIGFNYSTIVKFKDGRKIYFGNFIDKVVESGDEVVFYYYGQSGKYLNFDSVTVKKPLLLPSLQRISKNFRAKH